jgi:hypothetical protein
MSTPIAIEVNCQTGDVTERPLTAEEIAQREADAAAAATRRPSGSLRRRPRQPPRLRLSPNWRPSG